MFNEFQSRFPQIGFSANPVNSGFAIGANIGAAQATGEHLIFMNPDVIVDCGDIVALMAGVQFMGRGDPLED